MQNNNLPFTSVLLIVVGIVIFGTLTIYLGEMWMFIICLVGFITYYCQDLRED